MREQEEDVADQTLTRVGRLKKLAMFKYIVAGFRGLRKAVGKALGSSALWLVKNTPIQANHVTYSRIPLTLTACGILLFWGHPQAKLLAFWIFVASAVTDILDGTFARAMDNPRSGILRTAQEKDFGKHLDAQVDKICLAIQMYVICALLLTLDYFGAVLVSVVWCFTCAIEIWLFVDRQRDYTKNKRLRMSGQEPIELKASDWGKIKSTLQMIYACGFVLALHYDSLFLWWGSWIVWLSFFVAPLFGLLSLHGKRKARRVTKRRNGKRKSNLPRANLRKRGKYMRVTRADIADR